MASRESFSPDAELSKICTELWKADENRLQPGKDYLINLQEGTKVYQRTDMAKDPLFTFVSPEVLKRPTYKTFISLLDNYVSDTGKAEVVTPEEMEENFAFVDAIMGTKVMKKAHEYLVSKGKTAPDEKHFRQKLYDLWFELYKRSNNLDSSGFEHVFVGETRGVKKKKVIGFHNWIQFYLQEKADNVDYQGYIQGSKTADQWADSKSEHRMETTEGAKSHLLTIQFKWNRKIKPIGSTFIGTSPEFEVAIYTICFFCAKDTVTHIDLAGYHVLITCHKHGLHLGTSYPKAHHD